LAGAFFSAWYVSRLVARRVARAVEPCPYAKQPWHSRDTIRRICTPKWTRTSSPPFFGQLSLISQQTAELPEVGKPHALHQIDFDLSLYNVWKLQEKTTGSPFLSLIVWGFSEDASRIHFFTVFFSAWYFSRLAARYASALRSYAALFEQSLLQYFCLPQPSNFFPHIGHIRSVSFTVIVRVNVSVFSFLFILLLYSYVIILSMLFMNAWLCGTVMLW
jgi:hypothetical protein